MAIDIHLYDPSLTPISSTRIEVLELDRAGVKLDSQMNGAFGNGAFGCSLKTPSPAKPVTIVADDRSLTYAAVSLSYINGALSGKLDICLYPLPKRNIQPGTYFPGGGGGDAYDKMRGIKAKAGSMYLRQIDKGIQKNIGTDNWSEDEGMAVRILINSINQVLYMNTKNEELLERMEGWVNTLKELGIDPDTEASALELNPEEPVPAGVH
ncbi:hypothetical protein QTN47_19485 [Danxiaibacter flavus]|uniref:Uncharacterized protein n=1 Tax=Danxiaibacter flavus TaxID=3049108 RepID=A0ABV3ZIH5_9BACT|nr:hypothetical protein QNM32_19495 [Chitinophagaceae bacterium DXS]